MRIKVQSRGQDCDQNFLLFSKKLLAAPSSGAAARKSEAQTG
jgi:hypothetical protein